MEVRYHTAAALMTTWRVSERARPRIIRRSPWGHQAEETKVLSIDPDLPTSMQVVLHLSTCLQVAKNVILLIPCDPLGQNAIFYHPPVVFPQPPVACQTMTICQTNYAMLRSR